MRNRRVAVPGLRRVRGRGKHMMKAFLSGTKGERRGRGARRRRGCAGFTPTQYVDITAAREKKKSALVAHKSQQGEAIYRDHHEVMENFRGRVVRTAAAEAFVLLPSPRGSQKLPGS